MAGAAIRRAGESEVDDLVGLLLRANDEHLRSFPPAVASGYREELERLPELLPRDAEVFVADMGGRAAGMMAFLPDASADAHVWPPGGSVLRFLAVEPTARGAGLGRTLVSFCVDRARALDVRYLGLHTAPSMQAARHLYERLGFVRDEQLDFDPGGHYAAEAGESRWGLAYVLHFPVVEA